MHKVAGIDKMLEVDGMEAKIPWLFFILCLVNILITSSGNEIIYVTLASSV